VTTSVHAAVSAGRDGARLRVRLQPRARREGVVGVSEQAVRLAVHAPPVEGAANEALTRLLATLVGLPRGQVSVVLGASSRDKVVEFAGLTTDRLSARVAAWRDAEASQ